MENSDLIPDKELEDKIIRMYQEIGEIPKEHLTHLEQHARGTAENMNIYLRETKSDYILVMVKRGSY